MEEVQKLKDLATEGDPTAQNDLGLKYEENENYIEALEWFQKAAEQGNEYALCNLGRFYMEGIGVDESPKKAIKYFLAAAEMGNADAQFNVGLAYGKGVGVEQNLSEMARWMRKAEKNGNEYAKELVKEFPPDIYPPDFN